MNSFVFLEWKFTTLTKTINFMDVQLLITLTGIKSMLYKKLMNLYLYLPPFVHVPGILRSLIIGMIKRIYALTTKLSKGGQSLHRLFLCLCNRGYGSFILSPLFQLAISKAHLKRVTATYSEDDEESCSCMSYLLPIGPIIKIDPTNIPQYPAEIPLVNPFCHLFAALRVAG
jgi:hypothetical protein